MKNNIAAIRKQKGYSQKEFAEKVGISFWWLNNIENDKGDPSLALVLKIARVLEVTPNDIILDENWFKQPK
ncbi:helix-turn-helix transcriptional regulator [Heyndrickxia faecalis]|uniref:helix-turn-helix transcriptional regulator n=1 Tax=Heyndrickxia TaxID=2837504 RepID=UPI002F3A45D4